MASRTQKEAASALEDTAMVGEIHLFWRPFIDSCIPRLENSLPNTAAKQV